MHAEAVVRPAAGEEEGQRSAHGVDVGLGRDQPRLPPTIDSIRRAAVGPAVFKLPARGWG